MQCPRCQHENRPQAKFCEECAAPLARACSNCRTPLSPNAKFCPECAHPVAAGTTEPRFASPESYTPKHLAEKILTSRAALEGERKQITVLFADLKGSMELLADRDPEEARKLLDPVLEHMMEAVHRYEGTVNQVMGDGIMALFGAPLAHEDHAVRACYAALRMQESVMRYAEDARHTHGVNVQIRVGLNSGEVVVRAIGSDLHMDYTAVGQTTHLAARMEQIADPGAIVITPETLALVEGYVEVKSLGPVPVKGLASAVEVYEVTGAGPAQTRLEAITRRGLTQFVGRNIDLEQLRRAQELAGGGHGQVVAVVGEAGVGKSRLVYEFTHSRSVQGWLVLESTSVSYGKTTSYLPVTNLLRSYFSIQDRDDPHEVRERVTGKLLTLDRSLEPMIPAFLALLDVPVADSAWATLDPAERRRWTLDTVKRLLLREAGEQPVLLIFEDLHWIDNETQALLDGLVNSLGSARMLLLVNYRPEYQHAWGNKTYYSQLRLDNLPAKSAEDLLDALLGGDPGLTPLKQHLVKRGNPFFLEETIRMLAETKALAGERGHYRLTQPVQAIKIPPTVQAMLAARIDRLVPEEKRLLQIASVVGKDVPFPLLQAVAELPDDQLRAGLDHLQSAEFLYEAGLFPNLEYSFKHALTHEVTYAGLLQQRRRDVHARLVEAIERCYAGRLDQHVHALGHHALRAEAWDVALRYLRRAAALALSRSAYLDASALLEQAGSAAEHLPATQQRDETLLAIYFELWTTRFEGGPYNALPELESRVESFARALGQESQLSQLLVRRAQRLWVDGELREAVEVAEEALELASPLDVRTQSYARFVVAASSRDLGDFSRARNASAAGMNLFNVLAADDPQAPYALPILVSLHAWQAEAYAVLGRHREAAEAAQQGLEIAAKTANPSALSFANAFLGYVHLVRGDVTIGLSRIQQALDIARSSNQFRAGLFALVFLAYARALDGQHQSAVQTLQEYAAQDSTEMRQRTQSSRYRTLTAATYLMTGSITEAQREVEAGLELIQRTDARGHLPPLLRLRAELLLSESSPDEAAHDCREAIDLATALDLRPEVAHCHLSFSNVYRRTGRREQAREHLRIATTMYREMGMTYWLERVAHETTAFD
jgi:class 3 adenylate cyclase